MEEEKEVSLELPRIKGYTERMECRRSMRYRHTLPNSGVLTHGDGRINKWRDGRERGIETDKQSNP